MIYPNNRLVAYEYRDGPLNDVTSVHPRFFLELIEYLQVNNLASVLGLQILDREPSKEMVEIVLKDNGTVMLDTQEAKYGDLYRVTGWRIESEDRILAFKGEESHAKTTKGTHQVFVDGKALLDLATLKVLLKNEDVI